MEQNKIAWSASVWLSDRPEKNRKRKINDEGLDNQKLPETWTKQNNRKIGVCHHTPYLANFALEFTLLSFPEAIMNTSFRIEVLVCRAGGVSPAQPPPHGTGNPGRRYRCKSGRSCYSRHRSRCFSSSHCRSRSRYRCRLCCPQRRHRKG